MIQEKTETKFTPAPWYPINYSGFWLIQDENFYEGKDILDEEDFDSSTVEANAKLMAASPDLYEALKNVLPYLKAVGTNGNHWIPQIEEALKKATS